MQGFSSFFCFLLGYMPFKIIIIIKCDKMEEFLKLELYKMQTFMKNIVTITFYVTDEAFIFRFDLLKHDCVRQACDSCYSFEPDVNFSISLTFFEVAGLKGSMFPSSIQ